MQHNDLTQLLYKLATGAGAIVDFNTEITSVRPGDDNTPNTSVTLANGSVLYGDIIIGADGCQSVVREVVLDGEDRPRPGGLTVYTGTVRGEDMLKDPELEKVLLAEEVRLIVICDLLPDI